MEYGGFMSRPFGNNLPTNKHFFYKGDEGCYQTLDSDWVYNDGGNICYLDGIKTGWSNNPPVTTYYDPSVIRVR